MSFDLHFDAAVQPAALRFAIAQVLRVAATDVVVVADLTDLLACTERVRCVMRVSGGEFGTHVAVYARDVSAALSEVAFAQTLCRALGARALVGGKSIDPFRWVLVTASRTPEDVDVDVDALERDELTLAGNRSSS